MPTDEPYEVIISDEAMAAISGMSPEEQDAVAAAIREVRADPHNAGRKVVPHPVDYDNPATRADIPDPRTPPRLRAAVTTISPPTLQDLVEDWRQACAKDDPITAKRIFMSVWLEYVAIHGNPVYGYRWRELNRLDDMEAFGRGINQLLAEVHAHLFPLAAEHGDLLCHVTERGGKWVAVDPVLNLKMVAGSEEAARDALDKEHEAVLVL